MKNVCKKLFSLMLVAVMLVSILPMGAMAAEGDVHGNVKLADGTELGTISADVGSTLDEYVASVLGGEWKNEYNATKYWVKNDTTGSDGKTFNGDYTVHEPSKISIVVAHNDVSIDVEVYNKDEGSTKWHTFTVPYGSTFTVNSKILSKVGYNMSDIVTYGFPGYNEGETITATGRISIKVNITTTLRDDNTDADVDLDNKDDNNNNNNTSTAKKISWEVKIGNEVYSDSFTPSNGKDASVKNILTYQFKKGWEKDYTFAHYYLDGKTHEGADAVNDSIAAGKSVAIRLNPINNSDNNGGSTTGVKELNVQVKYNGKVYESKYDTYTTGTKVSISKDMIGDAFAKYDDNRSAYTISKIEEVKYGGTYDIGDQITMNVHKTLCFTLQDANSVPNSKDKHPAYLKIYTWDGSTASSASLAKTIRIDQKDQIGYDGVLDMGEKGDVRKLVREYFTAKDADGIGYDGLYIENGSNIYNWLTDSNKSSYIDDLDDMRAKNTTYIAVFIDNAKLKTSGTADSSNPKTGDSIFVAVTFMAVSATALTGLYLYNKKRMVK